MSRAECCLLSIFHVFDFEVNSNNQYSSFQLIDFIGYNTFWHLQLMFEMSTSQRNPQYHFQAQEFDQVGLLPKQTAPTSAHPPGHHEEGGQDQSVNVKQGNIQRNKKKVLYFIGFCILGVIIILDLVGHIGLNIKRRSDFLQKLQQIKTDNIADEDKIIDGSLEKTQENKSDRLARRRRVMPSFEKLSDIVLTQHVKQTFSQQNNGQAQQAVTVNPNSQPSINQVDRGIIQPTINNISPITSPLFQDETPNPTNTQTQQIQQNFFMKPPINSAPNAFTALVPTLQSLSYPANNDVGVMPAALKTKNLPVKKTKVRIIQTALISETQKVNAKMWKQLVHEDFTINSELAEAERKYYNDKYNILDYTELPFCVVVPTYNNAEEDRYLNNIRSIVMQEYANYHIVVIDDASTDSTGKLITDFLQQQNKIPIDRYHVVINPQQQMAMFNLRLAAIRYCKPEEIFLIVDGDDELLGRQVLHVFNAAFQKNQAWFVYSNFLGSSGNVGYSRVFPDQIIEDNDYRKYPFVCSHLRAYYTQLFRNIKEEDLRDDFGEYYRAANDVAISIPILEQAHKRVFYLPELTYYYNSNTGLNNHMVRLSEQKANDRRIRKKARYSELANLTNSR